MRDYRLIQDADGKVWRYYHGDIETWREDDEPPQGYEWYGGEIQPGARIEGTYGETEGAV